VPTGDDDAVRPPDDFTVEDILRAPPPPAEPGPEELAREARSALWELDFALQEIDWLRREGVREGRLVRSIISQIQYGTRHLGRFPAAPGPLPDDLCEELRERFARLTEELEALPTGWVGHEDLLGAHARLRAVLERRGVELD
jgi:hypothetical protein